MLRTRVGDHEHDRNAPADLLQSVDSEVDRGLLGEGRYYSRERHDAAPSLSRPRGLLEKSRCFTLEELFYRY